MYKLIAIDSNDKYIDICEYDDLLSVDYFTSKFISKDDFFMKLGIRFNKKINNVFIKYINNGKVKNIFDIVYSCNIIPSEEDMLYKYANFLNEDNTRISESYLRKFFCVGDTYMDILKTLEGKFKGYKTRRICYFHMLKHGKVELYENNGKDYLSELIDNIDTDDLSDQSIIIDKIRSGEIEPNYYDLDDYVSMKTRKR